MPRRASKARVSSAIAWTDMGRSMSAVRPWPCCSTAMTCRVCASRSGRGPNEVPVAEIAPCRTTTGTLAGAEEQQGTGPVAGDALEGPGDLGNSGQVEQVDDRRVTDV